MTDNDPNRGKLRWSLDNIPSEHRNDPKKFRNYQMMELVRQQISSLMQAYPELEEDDQLRTDMIEGETDAFAFLNKLELKRQDAEDMVAGVDLRLIELRSRQERFERREEAIRKLMFGVMQIAHIQKAELAEATLSIRNNPPRVIITDETLIPEDYIRIRREPNKSEIAADLKLGTIIPGAELSNAEPSLSVRTK